MPAWIRIIYGIIIAVSIKVKTIHRLGIKVIWAIGRDKPSPLRVIISCVEVIELYFSVVVITAVADGIPLCQIPIPL